MPDSCTLPPASSRLAAANALMEDCGRLPYVAGARAEALGRLGVATARDLLLRIPRRDLDFSHALTIEEAPIGEVATLVGTVEGVAAKRTRSRMSVVEVALVDDTGLIKLAFFKQPWIVRQIARGDRLAVMGKVEFAYGFKQMRAPHIEKLEAEAGSGTILPVHPATEGLSAAWMRRIVSSALERVGSFQDPLPAPLRARRQLMSAARALRGVHFPSALEEVAPARRRLAYDELLCLQLALRLRNDENLLGVPAHAHQAGEHVERLRAALPFRLSDEQEGAAGEILADMASPERIMNRLLLGDVGTGKTAVALFALAAVADSGTQAAVMAPTGVLAQQYAVKCGPVLDAIGVSWALVTGSTPASERARAAAGLAAGEITVAFGTQALLSDDVAFRRLTCVVIDEQHRFGTRQRNDLRAKGPGADLLVMTATPIPRTLALSVYGDLDVSIIRHRPRAGAGVATKVLTEPSRDVAYGAVREALAAGEQAYVVCPLVEESLEDEDGPDALAPEGEGTARLHDVASEAERLERVLPGARIGRLHGRMRPAEKDAAIAAFRAGETDILVSTTVVEVGVDVPAATVMVVENGERFGLATLHQLRGRVGRGDKPGRCFIMAPARASRSTRDRLEALEKTADGFALAELDLRLRHEGEILGYRQSGGVSLRFVDLDRDVDIIEYAQIDARELLERSGDLGCGALLPLRHEVIERYRDLFREVSGG